MAARFGFVEDTVRLAAALRPALAARGVPEPVYVDNGSAFVDASLKRACARLGIKLIHSQPGRPPLTGQYRLSPRDLAAIQPAWRCYGIFLDCPACRVDRIGSMRVTRVP